MLTQVRSESLLVIKGCNMLDENLIKIICIASLETVGLIEVLKRFITFKWSTWYTVIMIPLAFACVAMYLYLPLFVSAGILTVCFSQLFYKNFLQVFSAIIKKLEG